MDSKQKAQVTIPGGLVKKLNLQVTIYFPNRFLRKVRLLPDNVKKVFKEKPGLFEENPFHPSLRTGKTEGHDEIFEADIPMSVRMTREYHEDRILLRNSGHDRTRKKP